MVASACLLRLINITHTRPENQEVAEVLAEEEQTDATPLVPRLLPDKSRLTIYAYPAVTPDSSHVRERRQLQDAFFRPTLLMLDQLVTISDFFYRNRIKI